MRNTVKFARNLIKYILIQHILNSSWLVGLFNCCKLYLQIYLETSSPQQANNVRKLAGVNYVVKNWALVMILKALPLAHFLSALLLE